MSADREERQAMAEEELRHALSFSWAELLKITPWGDTHEAFAPSGAPVMVERNYLWMDQPGGAVQVEVAVYRNEATYDDAARASGVVHAP